MVDYEKLDRYIKIAIVIALIALLIVIRVYKLDSCDLILEETDKLTQGQIISIYYDECLKEYKVEFNDTMQFNYVPLNFST